MRFNKQELMTLATQPSQKFEKEGTLYVRERQEGFFRRTDSSTSAKNESKKENGKRHKSLRDLSCVSAGTSNKASSERWCRLRGNLLFYFKSREQWSEPLGVIILEHCTFRLDETVHEIYFGFSIVFDGGLLQQLGASSSEERDAWLQALQLASYECMRSQLLALRQRIEAFSGHKHDTDIHMLRLQRGIVTDPAEIPICEISVACDNLLCDGHGRPPNPVLEIDVEANRTRTWIKYAKTEIVERSSNPSFLTTVSFRTSDSLTIDSKVRITAYDVRERVSQTATPIGSAIVTFGAVQDTPRLRIPLKSPKSTTVGFLTINVWNLEAEDKGNSTEGTPSRSLFHNGTCTTITNATTTTTTIAAAAAASATNTTTNTNTTLANSLNAQQIFSHRRSHSLPPRLGTKIKLPHQGQLKHLFANPYVQTYRFHSGLGGDICVHEIMAESKLCFQFPQQLLAIWIHEEKELLQEVAGMGELREPWHGKQVQLLDRHLHLLHLYSQAKENLSSFKGSYFKRSTRKTDRTLEFAPVNLHLQRMWVHNDTLNKCGFYDFISVGAFAAHSHKNKNGGLIRLVQALKESPVRHANLYQGSSKIIMAHDAIQAIKQLRRDVVEAMRSLMKLAKEKQTSGMLPICEDMISKTRILLSLWDPGLVEEALTFLEEHKVAKMPDDDDDDDDDKDDNDNDDDDDNDDNDDNDDEEEEEEEDDDIGVNNGIGNDDGKNVDYDENENDDVKKQAELFATCSKRNASKSNQPLQKQSSLSPFKRITQQLNFDLKNSDFDHLVSPDTPECAHNLYWGEDGLTPDPRCTNLGCNCEIDSNLKNDRDDNFIIFPDVEDDEDGESCVSKETKKKEEEEEEDMMVGAKVTDAGKRFLDTQKMCNSPSANYYKPTDEPEPWDLTQLNIEASVMCLVSKVKFLCGRCSSPAVRLRNKNAVVSRSQSLKGAYPPCNDNRRLAVAGVAVAAGTVDAIGGSNGEHRSPDGAITVVTIQPKNLMTTDESSKLLKQRQYQSDDIGGTSGVGNMPSGLTKAKEVCQAVDTMTRVIKSNSSGQRNKFTEGLDFASIVDWTCELRPSMKKLRQAMDGLLKTARLTHSVFRVQEDAKRAQRACNVRYRRDVCFSQALTALVSALMAKLWCQRPDPLFLLIITTLGPLASFESLLSYYGNEIDMWGDMAVAVEDMHTVTFTLSRCGINSRIHEGKSKNVTSQIPLPRVVGSRAALTVMLPVPDAIYSLLPLVPSSRQTLSFNVTPVFFNIGINEKATLAENLGTTGPQDRSNLDNFDRLNEYYLRFKKLNLPIETGTTRLGARSPTNRTLAEMIEDLKSHVQAKLPKNTSVLQISSQICRRMRGLRFTSCKSAKDRTGMSLTLEQVNILAAEYHLSEHEFIRALDCMRSEGCRRENTWKNIGVRKYTFKSSILSLPKLYRPPTGTYG